MTQNASSACAIVTLEIVVVAREVGRRVTSGRIRLHDFNGNSGAQEDGIAG